MTKADKIYKVKCTYDMSSKNITFGMVPIRLVGQHYNLNYCHSRTKSAIQEDWHNIYRIIYSRLQRTETLRDMVTVPTWKTELFWHASVIHEETIWNSIDLISNLHCKWSNYSSSVHKRDGKLESRVNNLWFSDKDLMIAMKINRSDIHLPLRSKSDWTLFIVFLPKGIQFS